MLVKTIVALAVGLTLLLTGVPITKRIMENRLTQEVDQFYKEDSIPVSENSLDSPPVKVYDVEKTITLEASNMVVMRGPVTEDSVSDLMRELSLMSRQLSQTTPIYVVLDTPGGSIFDGMDLIQFAKALPQKVHTVTLYAASMGFIIAQNLNTRYIATNGTMMSHRASVRGLSGQVNGELEARYKMIKRAVDYLEYKSSKRMKLPLLSYRELINPEYWVHGFDAVAENAADEQVLLKCGRSLDGEEEEVLRTIFGIVKVSFSKCPLIKAPISMDLSRISLKNRPNAVKLVNLTFKNKNKFIRDYITTGNMDKFHQTFPNN